MRTVFDEPAALESSKDRNGSRPLRQFANRSGPCDLKFDFRLSRTVNFEEVRIRERQVSRRRSLISYYAARQRAAEQAARARARAQAQLIRSHQRFVRQQEHARLADAKEQLRLFHEAQEEDASLHNRDLSESLDQISSILRNALGPFHRLDFEKLKTRPPLKAFDPGPFGKVEAGPIAKNYYPAVRIFCQPYSWGEGSSSNCCPDCRALFDAEVVAHAKREEFRQAALEAERARYEAGVKDQVEMAQRQHDQVDALKSSYEAGDKYAVRNYCEAALSSQAFPEGWPQIFKLAYVPESKQLVVEYDFPGFEFIPSIAAYKIRSGQRRK